MRAQTWTPQIVAFSGRGAWSQITAVLSPMCWWWIGAIPCTSLLSTSTRLGTWAIRAPSRVTAINYKDRRRRIDFVKERAFHKETRQWKILCHEKKSQSTGAVSLIQKRSKIWQLDKTEKAKNKKQKQKQTTKQTKQQQEKQQSYKYFPLRFRSYWRVLMR